MACSPHDAMMIILASCLQLLGLRSQRPRYNSPPASSRHDIMWSCLRGLREVGNDLCTEQANRLQHVPLLAHGWPKQDMRDAQTLHVLEIADTLFWTANNQRFLHLLGTITAIPFVEQSLCFLTRSLERGSEMNIPPQNGLGHLATAAVFLQGRLIEMQLFLHATWGPTGADHPGIGQVGRALNGRVGARPNPHRQRLLQRLRV